MLIIIKSEAKKPIVVCRSPRTVSLIASCLPYPELTLLYRTHVVSRNIENEGRVGSQFTEELFTKPKLTNKQSIFNS